MKYRITVDGAPATCVQCDKPFMAYSLRAKYCSHSCKSQAYRDRKAGRVARNSKHKLSTDNVRATRCPHCGRTFSYQQRKPIYCSNSCKTMANRHKQKATASLGAMLDETTFGHAYEKCVRIGWKKAYAGLEELEYTYSIEHRTWFKSTLKGLF